MDSIAQKTAVCVSIGIGLSALVTRRRVFALLSRATLYWVLRRMACRPSISWCERADAAAQDQTSPGAAGLPAEARRLPAGEDEDAEEAELGAAQGGPRAADERQRSDGLHSGRGPQPAGALDRARPRRPREGSAGRALPHHPRHAGLRGRGRTAAQGRSKYGAKRPKP